MPNWFVVRHRIGNSGNDYRIIHHRTVARSRLPGTEIDTDALLAEIRATFPIVGMPRQRELRFHTDGCYQCSYLSEYLDERRNQTVDGAMIRYMHQAMSCVSASKNARCLYGQGLNRLHKGLTTGGQSEHPNGEVWRSSHNMEARGASAKAPL
jgi:hypothetical protein